MNECGSEAGSESAQSDRSREYPPEFSMKRKQQQQRYSRSFLEDHDSKIENINVENVEPKPFQGTLLN